MTRRTLALCILGLAAAAGVIVLTRREEVGGLVDTVVDSVRNAVTDLIAGFEGYSATVYQDVAGKWTIGYGHLVVPGDPYHPYGAVTEISREEADQLLDDDTRLAQDCVDRSVGVPLKD